MKNIDVLIKENKLEELQSIKFRYTETWEGLTLAVKYNSKAALDIVLNSIENFNDLHDKGFKALSLATSGGQIQFVETLLKKGAQYESTLGESCLSSVKSKEMAEVYKKYISSSEDAKILEESLDFWSRN